VEIATNTKFLGSRPELRNFLRLVDSCWKNTTDWASIPLCWEVKSQKELRNSGNNLTLFPIYKIPSSDHVILLVIGKFILAILFSHVDKYKRERLHVFVSKTLLKVGNVIHIDKLTPTCGVTRFLSFLYQRPLVNLADHFSSVRAMTGESPRNSLERWIGKLESLPVKGVYRAKDRVMDNGFWKEQFGQPVREREKANESDTDKREFQGVRQNATEPIPEPEGQSRGHDGETSAEFCVTDLRGSMEGRAEFSSL
jgi:hypothetical protein